jgi:probable rRNA maturation factor
MRVEIDINLESAQWLSFVESQQALFTLAAQTTLNNFANLASMEEVSLCILLTNNNYMRNLNKRYRNKDKATNVLSFCEIKIDYKTIATLQPSSTKLFLGTIALGYQIIANQAKEQAITFAQHVQRLVIHGVLHLLGFDHETAIDAAAMEPLEEQILLRLAQINKTISIK